MSDAKELATLSQRLEDTLHNYCLEFMQETRALEGYAQWPKQKIELEAKAERYRKALEEIRGAAIRTEFNEVRASWVAEVAREALKDG
jgi:predicted lipoprotein